jgi:hypothetical protein
VLLAILLSFVVVPFSYLVGGFNFLEKYARGVSDWYEAVAGPDFFFEMQLDGRQ